MRLRSCSKMATIEEIQAEFRSLSTDLKKQMESMELGIAARIKDVVLEHMTIMKEEITGRLDALEGRIVALEDRLPPSVPSDELACNFVVYGLAESDDENVSDKVNNLLLGQLKIENVRVAEAVRKDKFNNNTCGVVVAKCSNIDDKNKVMEAKSKLRDTEHFSHISIVHDKPKWQRQHEANLRLVVKTLGTNKLFIRGNRVCTTNDQHGWQNNGGRERGQNPVRGRGQGRGHGRGRGGPRGRRGQGPNRNVER